MQVTIEYLVHQFKLYDVLRGLANIELKPDILFFWFNEESVSHHVVQANNMT